MRGRKESNLHLQIRSLKYCSLYYDPLWVISGLEPCSADPQSATLPDKLKPPGFRDWTRTNINGSKNRCPTFRRPGSQGGEIRTPVWFPSGSQIRCDQPGYATPWKTKSPKFLWSLPLYENMSFTYNNTNSADVIGWRCCGCCKNNFIGQMYVQKCVNAN